MHRYAAVALADIDQIRADTADRSDLHHPGMTLKDTDQPGNTALGQHLVQNIRLADPGLRTGRRSIIDHNRERTWQALLLSRQTC